MEIRQLYRSEQDKIIKLAPCLTSKSCWSSTLEFQNVGIAVIMFDESSSAALAIQNSSKSNPKYRTQTWDFKKLICNVWKIFNVNTPFKGPLFPTTYKQ